MPVKIRLQRFGKKGYPFYHIVIADGRAPRDGKFIEKLGTYNPNTNPAAIDINLESTLTWLKNGAQPTETARAILSYKGVLMKLHLDKGVLKGALTEEQANAKFEKWLEEKQGKVEAKKVKLASAKETSYTERIKAETEKNKARAAAIVVKNTPIPEAVEEAPADEVENVEAATVETPAEVEEAPVAEVPVEEVTEEAPVAEPEAPTAEAVEETPAAEAAPEAPADETEETKPSAE
jgi:small subunit ribosomal protein S16